MSPPNDTPTMSGLRFAGSCQQAIDSIAPGPKGIVAPFVADQIAKGKRQDTMRHRQRPDGDRARYSHRPWMPGMSTTGGPVPLSIIDPRVYSEQTCFRACNS